MIESTAIQSAASAAFGLGSPSGVESGPASTTQAKAAFAARAGQSPVQTAAAVSDAPEAAMVAAKAGAPKDRATAKETTESAEAAEAAERKAEEAEAQPERVQLADFWRTRLDPESLRVFTEIIDPDTRDARYTIPPTMELSEEAQREGESLSKRERLRQDTGLVV